MNTPNTGVLKATAAALAVNAKIVVPEFKDISTHPTDLNDLARAQGLPEVQRQISNAKEVESINHNETAKTSTLVAKVIELSDGLELFCDRQKVAYVTITNNDHHETMRLDSRDFQNWLRYLFWKRCRLSINANAMQEVLGILQGKACNDCECKEVYIRVASINDAIYIDLVNEKWETIKITNSGWEILSNSPVKFIRFNHMQALPVPIKEGNIDNIWQFLNIPQKYRKLVLAFILECFRSHTPFPILVLYGSQGSAKSTTQQIIRMLIDPSAHNLRSAPKKREDLLVAAANNWVVSFNNVSYLSDEQQDDLCCVSTGGALSTRQLYTTHQEASVDIKRAVILNGITDLITAQDLIDRCITAELPEILPENRKAEEEILRAFYQEYAAIFGSLLIILAKTLQILPTINLVKKPRMADFALLGCALEKALGWHEGSFMNDYLSNRNDSMASALDHSPVAVSVIRYIKDKLIYEGSYGYLYDELTRKYKPDMVGWPKSEKGLSIQLKRQKQALKAVGIEVTFDTQRHSDGYHVSITKVENNVHDVHDVHNPFADAP